MNEKKLAACFMLLEYATIGVVLTVGSRLLDGMSSRCFGFRFLGVTIVVIGVTLLIMVYIACATIDLAPGLALAKSLCCSVPLLVVLVTLGIFALKVSSKGGGKSLPGRSYDEYHVESYSKWMYNKVNDTYN